MKRLFPVRRKEFYDPSLLSKWKSGDYSMLTSSSASDYIKKLLTLKAQQRPGGRFFGEAYVASALYLDAQAGWYNSFKWLTSDKWLVGRGLDPFFEKPFHDALMRHIGYSKLAEIQEAANLYSGKSDKSPVAPDLWFINGTGGFDFVEVKHLGDRVAEHQLAGMSILKEHLVRSTVAIINLAPR